MVSPAYEASSAMEVTMAGPGSGRMGLTINQTVKSPIIVGYGIHAQMMLARQQRSVE
jgi:hypothetical protein